MEMLLIAGLDIGNGYVKGRASQYGAAPTNIDFPSGAAVVTTSHNIETPDSAIPGVMQDIFNELDASFDTPLVKRTNRRLFGRRGIESGMFLDQFNVASNHESKAEKDLSAVLTLGSLAGKALQDYYAEHQALPPQDEIIQVHARTFLALPINEYVDYRVQYAQGYTSTSHMVTVYNFKYPVRFQIFFDDVQVVAEGAAAQSAIIEGGAPLMQSLLTDLRNMEPVLPGITERLNNITPEMLLGVKRTVGIDIGEGTVNFPVMNGAQLNADVSTHMDQGYGKVLEKALTRLKKMHHNFNSRKELTEFLNTERNNPMHAARYNAVAGIVDEEIDGFTDEIEMKYREVMGGVGVNVDLVYVYGGGATPVRHKLYPALLRVAQDFGGINMTPPVLYLDSRYSRNLNRNGLYILANLLTQRVMAAQNQA